MSCIFKALGSSVNYWNDIRELLAKGKSTAWDVVASRLSTLGLSYFGGRLSKFFH